MITLESFFADLRLAFRLSRKHSVLKLAVIMTLALGIGANTAIFTVLNAVLSHKLPYDHAGELVIFQTVLKEGRWLEATSYPRFRDWANDLHSFEEVAGESSQILLLSGQGETEPLQSELVSANYFSALRLNVALGRTFVSDETKPGNASPVALISDGLWKRRFVGDLGVVGKAIQLNDHSFTVIGVLPPGVQGISQKAEVWIPITMINVVSTGQLLENPVATWVTTIARLKSGTSLQAAQQEMNVVSARLPSDSQEENSRVVQIIPLQSRAFQRYSRQVYILFGAVGFVLLIACLNVANLLLSYFTDRKSELAVRNALGASRFRLLQQLLLESVVLSTAGGGLGLVLAVVAVRWFGASVTSILTGIGTLEIDTRVFLFTAVVSFLTGAIAGLLPLMQVVTDALSDNLKSGPRSGTKFARAQLRTALVIGQISMAVVLVVGAGLMLRSMLNMGNVDLGFQSNSVLIAQLTPLPAQKYDSPEKIVGFYDSLLEGLALLPQVRAVGITSSVPLLNPSPSIPFLIRGRSDLSEKHPPTVQYLIASQDYFTAMSVPLLQGRVIERSDTAGSPPVAVINETLARTYWPGQSPIGQYLRIFDGGPPRQIVGVVSDVRDSSVTTASVAEVYLSYQQIPVSFISILKSFPPAVTAKTSGMPKSLASSVRSAVAALEPNEAVLDVSTMESLVSQSVAEPRLYSQLLLMFALLALGLAGIGIYGVVSYSVAQRKHEFGVRLALGASRGTVIMLVLRQGMLLALAGMSLGVLCAWALTRVLQAFLFEIKTNDPTTFALAVVALWAVCIAAAFVPSWRASQLDPGSVLREA